MIYIYHLVIKYISSKKYRKIVVSNVSCMYGDIIVLIQYSLEHQGSNQTLKYPNLSQVFPWCLHGINYIQKVLATIFQNSYILECIFMYYGNIMVIKLCIILFKILAY